MQIFTTLQDFPITSEEYYKHYHERAFDQNYPIITTRDMESILNELRLAFKKYPDQKHRVSQMAIPIKVYLNRVQKKQAKTLVDEAKQALL